MRKATAFFLDALCGVLDCIPRCSEGRWYRYGDWGCQIGIARFGADIVARKRR